MPAAGAAVNKMRASSWGRKVLAPHTGHVSNFCGVKPGPLEPVIRFQINGIPPEICMAVHPGRPVWTRLELGKGTLGNFWDGAWSVRSR